MKIGVIFCAWQTEDLVGASTYPWLVARRNKLDDNEFVICAVSVPFAGFPQDGKPDNTRNFLREFIMNKEIDHFISGDEPMLETEARTQALKWLKEQGVETVIQCDSDETWRVEEIQRVFAWWAANPFMVWARVSYKNFVFNDETYLTEPFTPPRIHRIRPKVGVLTFEASQFIQDNDIAYVGGLTRDLKVQGQFASRTIPTSLAFVSHFSWPNNSRSKAKVAYQEARGWQCSFAWDDAQGGLIWNGAPQETETDL